MRRWNLPLLTGLALLALLLASLLAPSLVDTSAADLVKPYQEVNGATKVAPFAPGVNGYALGTDMAGRDVFMRVLAGGRLTLGLAVGVLLARFLIAVPLGLVLGWVGGSPSGVMSSLASATGAIPNLIFLLLLTVIVQPLGMHPVASIMLVLTLVGLPRLTEQVRKVTIHLKELPHIEAAVSLGATSPRILAKHIWPIMKGDLAVTVASELAWVLIMLTQMAIFGRLFVTGQFVLDLGIRRLILDDAPEWATMLAVNYARLRSYWWIPLYPAVALGLATTCFHMLAEGMRIRWVGRR
jgi:peptide/nickel transport system permease protein